MKRQRWSTGKNRGIAARSCSYLTHDCRTCSVQLTGRTSGDKKETWLKTSTLHKREKSPRSRRQKMEQWGNAELSSKNLWKAEVNERQLKQEQYHNIKISKPISKGRTRHQLPEYDWRERTQKLFTWTNCVVISPCLSHTMFAVSTHTALPSSSLPLFLLPFHFSLLLPIYLDFEPSNLTAQPLRQP